MKMVVNMVNKVYLILFIMGAVSLSQAQVPNGLNFQSIIRDGTSKPLSNKNVNIRFSILKGGVSGTLVFSEEHRTLTNEFGLVNVLIGYGFPVFGAFRDVTWGDGSFFLKTEIDPNGGINYELSGVTPFLSVPYALYSERTKLEAGPGIQIDANKITNTGDADPTDDLKIGSPVSGDLKGNLPSPQVVGLQGRVVQDIMPLNNQALVWNGSQWVPAMVDNDPSNDVLINSASGGDLSGSFPNPKVVKLNGIPLATSNPDSGDVLVFSQGEWKHFPVNTGSGSSVWKKNGNDIVMEDPLNVKKVYTANASIATHNQIFSSLNADSTIISPLGLLQKGFMGSNLLKMHFTPGTFTGFRNNDTLMRYSTLGLNADYSRLRFYNRDPAVNYVGSYIDPYSVEFHRMNPDRYAYLSANDFEIYRKSKDSPVEYDGVYVTDSFMYYYRGKNDMLAFESESLFGGEMFLFDKNGKERMSFSALIVDQTQPYFSLVSTKTNREVVELLGYNSAGEMYLYNSNNDLLNVYAGYSSLGPNYPYISIGDGAGSEAAGLYLNSGGQGVVFADIKSFRMQDPEVENQEIWYACVEGPEAAAYERGSSILVNGEAFVPYSEHFLKVANTKTMTVQLTPGYADTYGIAVVEKLSNGFTVKELQGRKGNFSFDWEVKAVRKGYEEYNVYHKKESLFQNKNIKGNTFTPAFLRSKENRQFGSNKQLSER